MNRINMDGYVRLTKHEAKFLHNAKCDVFILPNKMRPGNMWMSPVQITEGLDFSNFVDEFQRNNCNYELGYYPAFYRKVAF